MKTHRPTLLVLAAVILCCGLSSCSNDDPFINGQLAEGGFSNQLHANAVRDQQTPSVGDLSKLKAIKP